jgi:hypothetical protein
MVRTVVAAALLAALLAPWSGEAQQKRRVIRLDEIAVEGRIQKPQAFYILPRSSLNYQSLERTETFLPKILKALEQEPF